MISTSGHLISKFPEVRFHRTRISTGRLIANEAITLGINVYTDSTFRAEFNDEITVDEIFELVGIPFEKTWNLLFNNTLQEFSHPL